MPEEPRKKAGRPRSPEPGSTLSTWVNRKEYDRLYEMAKTREESVSALVRSMITRVLRSSS